MSRSSNSSRSDADKFLPEHQPCRYAEAYVAAKRAYGLTFDLDEAQFYLRQIEQCGVNRSENSGSNLQGQQ